MRNPFKFTKSLLSDERSGTLESPREEVEEHLFRTHSDPDRNTPLGECSRIEQVNQPEVPFDLKEPSLKEVQDIVKKARAGSAPGPSGTTYSVYKNCPMLLRRLWRLMRTLWKKETIPESWKRAEGCFVPKEKDSRTVEQFRTISLLSVECKIFFSILSRRLTSYLTSNQYIDTSAQNGAIPGFSGCIEHTSILSQMIKETKADKGDLTVVWLDLANAYGGIPHKLIDKALHHYHVPDEVRKIVKSYFNGMKIRFKSGDFTTNWQDLEKGIVTGCTVSPILFVMAMNIIMETAERETRGPMMKSGIYQPANRGYMDDLTITTKSHIQARWVLNALDEVVTWARMKFKPKKSRCMIMRKGRIVTNINLLVQGEAIPSIKDNPIKCLGKWYDDSLRDHNNIDNTKRQVSVWLNKIDKSGLPGKFKAWIYQHGILPRIAWQLTLYEFPMSSVESLERTINQRLRKWLGIPPSFSSIGLYSRSSQLQLPLSSVVEEFKVSKCRLVMTLMESNDKKVRKAGVETKTGQKWSANTTVNDAESMLQLRDIVGNTCIGRQGLGTGHFQQ